MNNENIRHGDAIGSLSTGEDHLSKTTTNGIKIICSKETLISGVQTIQSALSSRTTLPVLHNFLMETEGRRLKFSSTNLEMGMTHYLSAEIESAGSVTVPARKFHDIVQSLPDNHDVEIAVDSGSRVQVKSGRSRFCVMGTPKSEYPILPEFRKEAAFRLPTSLLMEALRKTLFAASSDETRYVLNGVFWMVHDGNLELVATDGRRMALIKRKYSSEPGAMELRAIIPTKVLLELVRLLGSLNQKTDGNDEVSVSITENQAAFQFASTTLISRLVEGAFPNYEQVLPSKKDICMAIDAQSLQALIKRAALCATDRGGAVRLTLGSGILQIQSSSQGMEFHEEMPLEYQGEDFTIAFNPQFILDGLKQMCGTITLGMTTPAYPVLIQEGGDPQYQYVIMPMRG